MKISNFKFQISNGQSLVEILVVIGLLSILLPALITGLVSSRGGEAQQKQRIDATALLKEGADAVRNIKYNDWNLFACFVAGGTCNPSSLSVYLQYNSTSHQWELVAGTVPTINGFIRTVVINNVSRDSSGNIVSSGGTNDPSTKKVTITVSWSTPYNSSINSTFFLSRLDNLVDLDTTTDNSQFNGGNKDSVAVVAGTYQPPPPIPTPNDGKVELGRGGTGDWCNPILNDNSHYKLTLSGNSTTTAAWSTPGLNQGDNDFAYVVTGGTASSDSYTLITITDTQPPNPSAGTPFANYKVAGIVGDLAYAYLAVTSPASKQAAIIRLSDSQEMSTISTGDNGRSHSIFILGNTLFFTSQKQNNPEYLYAYDVTDKSNPVRIGSSTNRTQLHGVGKKMYVINTSNYTAYIATDSTTNQLDIVNFSNPSSLPANPTSTINVGNSQPGADLFVDSAGTRAYLVTNVTSSSQTDSDHSDFFIINTADGTKWGHYNTHPMNPKGNTIVPVNIGVIVGTRNAGNPYQVISVSENPNNTPPNPLLSTCGVGLPNATFDINGLTSLSEKDGDAYSYIVTNESSTPTFRIIPGGPGGAVGTTGTFTSRAFVPGGTNSTAFNKFIVNFNQQANTTLTFKVASANLVSNSCTNANYTFVGPNLDSTPYVIPASSTSPLTFTIPFGTASPGYTNPGFCFKYQAIFNSSVPTRSSVLYDVTLNYSP